MRVAIGDVVSPKVSVILPCRDHGRFLGEALASLDAQTRQDFEVVIVDDGSTDPDTITFLRNLSHPKVRVRSVAPSGVTRARNLGIAETSAPYLSFFDADDRMHPEFLERTLDVLEANPGIAFVSTWARLFGDEEWEWKPTRCDFPRLLHECSVATASLVRRSVVEEVGGFDAECELGHEDWELWLSIVERGHRGQILPQILFDYRRAGESRSSTADRIHLELYRDRIRKHEGVYRSELFELLWLKESEVLGPLHTSLAAKRAEVARELEPRVELLRTRLDAALQKP